MTREADRVADDEHLQARIERLRADQAARVESLLDALETPVEWTRYNGSDIASEEFVLRMADVLLMHHAVSLEPFTKDKFEFAMTTTLQLLGHQAEMAPRGNPGWDLTIDGVPTSLKTQADKTIKRETITISKFMELGKGEWILEELRARMFEHMTRYERIFTFRGLVMGAEMFGGRDYEYELVEIPHALLLKAETAALEVMTTSKQSPQPGFCRVFDDQRRLLFELYFDGGTERKLTVRKLATSACIVHAGWKFRLPG